MTPTTRAAATRAGPRRRVWGGDGLPAPPHAARRPRRGVPQDQGMLSVANAQAVEIPRPADWDARRRRDYAAGRHPLPQGDGPHWHPFLSRRARSTAKFLQHVRHRCEGRNRRRRARAASCPECWPSTRMSRGLENRNARERQVVDGCTGMRNRAGRRGLCSGPGAPRNSSWNI